MGQQATLYSTTILQAKHILDIDGPEQALRFLVESELKRLLSPEMQALIALMQDPQSENDDDPCAGCPHAATCALCKYK